MQDPGMTPFFCWIVPNHNNAILTPEKRATMFDKFNHVPQEERGVFRGPIELFLATLTKSTAALARGKDNVVVLVPRTRLLLATLP